MRSFTLGILVAMYSLPALAAGGVGRVIPGTNTTMNQSIDTDLRVVASTSDTTTVRDTGENSVVARTTRTPNSTRTIATTSDTGRTIATRNITRAISTDTPAQGADTTRSTTNRSVAVTRSVSNSETARSNLEAAVRNVGRSQRTDAASINANPAVRRAGLTLRPSTAEVGGRAILESGAQTGSNIESEIQNMQSRVATVRVREEQKLDPAIVAENQTQLEQTAALNKSCQEQYNDCMDQFCSVIDANQKRCSCSANLAKYAKVEKAVKDANAELNEVAQNIRYVGLSADEISAIMSATEAEEAMTGVVDTTENRNLLDQIEKMIKDPTTTTSASIYASDSLGLLDMDLDFSSDEWSDLFSLDSFGTSVNSFSNLRGANLYNAAKKRCNTIVNQCKDVGATAEQITGNYDLAIDKDCIAYEQGLNKMNETLVSNVRSATRMLQKARLAVLQNQNTYDARGCIGALETCMTDDMVCGDDYFKCIDPTKMYVDENGSVVLGRNVTKIQRYMANYNNATIDSTKLNTAYGMTINDSDCASEQNNDGRCIVKYLLTKIGTQQDPVAEGLCRPVLDKCRAYTYDTRGNYNRFNDIVVNYIQRAMVNIRAAQYKIVSDYASTCLNDIATCYNSQVSQISSWATTASATSVYNIMRGACRNVALTCGYAIFAADTRSCPIGETQSNENRCIESISEIFYQSLLCPDNSEYRYRAGATISPNNTIMGYVNKLCQCREGYVSFDGACLPKCDNGQYLSMGVCGNPTSCPTNSYTVSSENAEFWGHCKCNSGYYWYENGQNCIQCPGNSNHTPSDSYNGDEIYEGVCTCATNHFKYHGNQCKACPDGATLTMGWTEAKNRCTCSGDKPHYNYYCNTCVESDDDIQPSMNCADIEQEQQQR